MQDMQELRLGLVTSKYRIVHLIKIPSRILDYDYDDTNLNRRFISTYIHSLEFYDAMTGTKLYEFSFPSDACAEMIASLYKLQYDFNYIPNDFRITIPSTPSVNLPLLVMFYLASNTSTPTMVMRITNSCTTCIDDLNIIFYGEQEINAFIDLLEADEVTEMFVEPSSDRW